MNIEDIKIENNESSEEFICNVVEILTDDNSNNFINQESEDNPMYIAMNLLENINQ